MFVFKGCASVFHIKQSYIKQNKPFKVGEFILQPNPELPGPCSSSSTKMATASSRWSWTDTRGSSEEGEISPLSPGKAPQLAVGLCGESSSPVVGCQSHCQGYDPVVEATSRMAGSSLHLVPPPPRLPPLPQMGLLLAGTAGALTGHPPTHFGAPPLCDWRCIPNVLYSMFTSLLASSTCVPILVGTLELGP